MCVCAGFPEFMQFRELIQKFQAMVPPHHRPAAGAEDKQVRNFLHCVCVWSGGMEGGAGERMWMCVTVVFVCFSFTVREGGFVCMPFLCVCFFVCFGSCWVGLCVFVCVTVCCVYVLDGIVLVFLLMCMFVGVGIIVCGMVFGIMIVCLSLCITLVVVVHSCVCV